MWKLFTLIRLDIRKLRPVLSRTLKAVDFESGVSSFWLLTVTCLCGAVCFWFTHVQPYFLEELMTLSGWRILGSCLALVLGFLCWLGFERTKNGHQFFLIFGFMLIQVPLLITSLILESAYPLLHPINDVASLFSFIYYAAKAAVITTVLVWTKNGLSQPGSGAGLGIDFNYGHPIAFCGWQLAWDRCCIADALASRRAFGGSCLDRPSGVSSVLPPFLFLFCHEPGTGDYS